MCFYLSFVAIVAFIISNTILVFGDMATPLSITLCMMLLSIGFVIPCNTMILIALDTMAEAKGRISALISTSKWIFTIIGLQTASFFYASNYAPIGIVTILMIMLALFMGIVMWKLDPKLKVALVG